MSDNQRVRLSSGLKYLRNFIIIFIIVLTAGWINAIRLSFVGIRKGGYIELPVLMLIGVALIYLIGKLKTIEFDPEFIYVSNKKGTEIIPLKNITKIKLIMIEVGGADFYRMYYTSADSKQKSVIFLPTGSFNEFVGLIKVHKKNFKVQQWTLG